MVTTLGIALGGALGATLRYLVGLGLEQRLGSGFPFGTLTVNLVGCLLIGLLAALFVDATEGREQLRLFLIVGCLGGFTTFSSFGLDTLRLLQDGAVRLFRSLRVHQQMEAARGLVVDLGAVGAFENAGRPGIRAHSCHDE